MCLLIMVILVLWCVSFQRFSVLCTPVQDPIWQKNDDGTTVELASAAVST